MSLTNSEIDNLRRAIGSLRRHASKRIDSLHGQLKTDFETITSYANILQGTADYKIFDELIREQFSNINSMADQTIGLSLAGCLVNEKQGNDSCTPSCLGNVPTINTSTCEETVVVAMSKNEGYFFITKNIGRKEYARLYLSEYRGFSVEEKNYLKQNNINAVILLDFQNKPININGSNIHYVHDLPERAEVSMAPVTPDDKVMLYLIFIVIFALILAIVIILYKSQT